MRTDKSPSRSSRHKRTSDRALKWSISIVSILILAVGCIFVAMLLKTSSEEAAPTHQQVNDKHISSNNKDTKNDSSSKNDDNRVSNNPDESTINSSDTTNEESNEETNDKSSEEHVTSYDEGTADWNAQIKAMSEATGIPESNMTVYWLGNGGGPNSSLGRVAPKDAPSQKYVVHLEYKKGKWEAESVKKPSE